ncbi:unnamed protein product, partial [Scytosiphon promiscuus]
SQGLSRKSCLIPFFYRRNHIVVRMHKTMLVVEVQKVLTATMPRFRLRHSSIRIRQRVSACASQYALRIFALTGEWIPRDKFIVPSYPVVSPQTVAHLGLLLLFNKS